MVLDVPNALIQTSIPSKKDGEEKVITKIIDVIVDIILGLDSETYRKNVVFENGKKVIYFVVLREIYGMLVAALLFYNCFIENLKILDLSSIITIHVCSNKTNLARNIQ